MTGEPQLVRGSIDAEVAAEFPELALIHTELPARPARSPADVRELLRHASDRFTGPKAVALRQQPIPWAYRVFFRHIGIDPDERRTPVEAIAVERLRAGGFRPTNIVDDAVLVATLETAVPVLAFDADRVDGGVGIRLARADERLGSNGIPLVDRQLVVCDDRVAIAVLFGDRSRAHTPSAATRRVLLAAVQVKGVPDVSVEEALWLATDMLGRFGPR
jgi:DNA/RNA-binding domain of Phe-tRNA-synthetase-like protein